MKKSEFEQALNQRLKENSLIFKNPGIGNKIAPLSSAVGLHSFWIILFLSFVGAFIFTQILPISDNLNRYLFGKLYG